MKMAIGLSIGLAAVWGALFWCLDARLNRAPKFPPPPPKARVRRGRRSR